MNFEEQYIALRKKENRLYTDEEIKFLPDISPSHPHYAEWQIRKDSCTKLIRYLDQKNKPLAILEVGCGNGWLSAQLAKAKLGHVMGTDINKIELAQARNVFKNMPNLDFVETKIEEFEGKFDVIIFAASIQYFSSFRKIIATAMKLLSPNGEIHILDSHFYKKPELDAAKQRSIEYYTSIGFPGIADHYFHHSIEELVPYRHKIRYDPESFLSKFKKNKKPFYWICIYNAGNVVN